MTQDKSADVALSYGRCLWSKNFFDDFYESFFGKSPAIVAVFAQTDMQRQKSILRWGISARVAVAEERSSFVLTEMERLAITHGRRDLDVPEEYYAAWVDSLMETVRTHDPNLHPALEKIWREVLDAGVDHLISHG